MMYIGGKNNLSTELKEIEKSHFSENMRFLEEIDKFGYELIVNKEKEVKGYIIYNKLESDKIEIVCIATNKDFLKRGVASGLLEELILKFPNAILSLEVSEGNVNAISLYNKYKFKRIAVRKKMYGDEHGLLMVRNSNENISN